MTEVDKVKGNTQIAPQTRRSVLAKFIANFSGGVSLNTVFASGDTALAQVSAGMDSRVIHLALEKGGHSKTRLEGSFEDMVPLEKVENVLHRRPGRIIHITEGEYSDLLEAAPKPAVINGNLSNEVLGRPAKVIYLNVVDVDESPGEDIEHWFKSDKRLKPAA